MKKFLSRAYLFSTKLFQTTSLMIAFIIVCIIFIAIVIYENVILPPAYPAAFVITDVTSQSAAAAYVTPQIRKTCSLWWSFIPPQIKLDCDKNPSRVHRQEIKGLHSATSYQVVIVSGLNIWAGFVDPVNGHLEDQAYIPQPFPILKTLSKGNDIDRNAQQLLLGKVVNGDQLQADAVVEVVDKNNLFISTETNGAGTFSLVLPGSWENEELTVIVWSETGFVILPQPAALFVNVPQTLRVVPYD